MLYATLIHNKISYKFGYVLLRFVHINLPDNELILARVKEDDGSCSKTTTSPKVNLKIHNIKKRDRATYNSLYLCKKEREKPSSPSFEVLVAAAYFSKKELILLVPLLLLILNFPLSNVEISLLLRNFFCPVPCITDYTVKFNLQK